MNILFVNPPFLPFYSREQRSPAVTKSGTLYFPMWLCYAAGLAEKNGHAIKVVDCPTTGETVINCEELARQFKPQIIVIDTSTPSIHSDVKVAARLKEVSGGAYTVLVGPHVSALPEDSLAMEPTIDAIALREYDHTISDVAAAIAAKKPLSEVTGLCIKENGAIKRTAQRDLSSDLDNIPFVSSVYKKHLDYKKYFYAHSKYPIVVTITGRGCPHQCVYCVYPQTFNGRKVRSRSIANIVDEIEYILKEFQDVKDIMFEDDTLTINKKRCLEFAEEIQRRKLKFSWSANSRCDIDLETLIALKRAGARLFCVGVESGEQTILDNMKKNLTVERIRQFYKDAKKAGILIHGCFLVGNPGETKATLQTTLNFAKELNPDSMQFYPIMIYPGTEAWMWAEKNGYLTTKDFKEWLTPDGMHNCVLSRPGLSNKELVEFCDNARKEFYLRPSFLLSKLWQGIKNPYEMKRLIKGGLYLSKYIFRGTYGGKN